MATPRRSSTALRAAPGSSPRTEGVARAESFSQLSETLASEAQSSDSGSPRGLDRTDSDLVRRLLAERAGAGAARGAKEDGGDAISFRGRARGVSAASASTVIVGSPTASPSGSLAGTFDDAVHAVAAGAIDTAAHEPRKSEPPLTAIEERPDVVSARATSRPRTTGRDGRTSRLPPGRMSLPASSHTPPGVKARSGLRRAATMQHSPHVPSPLRQTIDGDMPTRLSEAFGGASGARTTRSVNDGSDADSVASETRWSTVTEPNASPSRRQRLARSSTTSDMSMRLRSMSAVPGLGFAPPSPHESVTSISAFGTATEQSVRITVGVRVRCMLEQEEEHNGDHSLAFSTKGTSIVEHTEDGTAARRYDYDHCFGPAATNADVYDRMGRPIISAAMEGYNCTIFAYGQTSSGKTHTILGDTADQGVLVRAVHEIFSVIEATPERQFLVRMSYLEIYNEAIRDLLNVDATLRMVEDAGAGVVVQGLTEEVVLAPHDVVALLLKGEENRHNGVTNMNARSSRSHTVFRLIIESQDGDEVASSMAASGGAGSATYGRAELGSSLTPRRSLAAIPRTPGTPGLATSQASVTMSILNFVDLAGSERLQKTGATGARLKEGALINQSLLTLGTVISKLADRKHHGHIPYRDSKLTRLLQTSLGGNARTSMIVTVSPVSWNRGESRSSLNFASRAKTVVNKAKVNKVSDNSALLEQYRKEIAMLRAQLAKSGGEQDGLLRAEDGSLVTAAQLIKQIREEEVAKRARLESVAKEHEQAHKETELRLQQMEDLLLISSQAAGEGKLHLLPQVHAGLLEVSKNKRRASTVVDAVIRMSGVTDSDVIRRVHTRQQLLRSVTKGAMVDRKSIAGLDFESVSHGSLSDSDDEDQDDDIHALQLQALDMAAQANQLGMMSEDLQQARELLVAARKQAASASEESIAQAAAARNAQQEADDLRFRCQSLDRDCNKIVGQLQSEVEQNEELAQRVSQLQSEADELRSDRATMAGRIAELQARLTEANAKAAGAVRNSEERTMASEEREASLLKELSESKGYAEAAEKRLAEMQLRNDQLLREIDALQASVLKRQAAQSAAAEAEKNAQRRADDANSALNNATKTIGDLEAKLSSAAAAERRALEQLESITDESKRRKVQVEDLLVSVEEQQKRIKSAEEAARAAEDRLSSANARTRAAEEINAELRKRLDSALREESSLSDALRRLKADHEKALEAHATCTAQQQELHAQIASVTESRDQTVAELREKETALKDVAKRLHEYEERCSSLAREAATARSTVEEVSEARSQLESALVEAQRAESAMRESLEAEKAKSTALQKRAVAAESGVADREHRVEQLTRDLQDVREAAAAARAQLEQAKQDNSRLDSRVIELQGVITDLEAAEVDATRRVEAAEAAAKRQGAELERLRGMYGSADEERAAQSLRSSTLSEELEDLRGAHSALTDELSTTQAALTRAQAQLRAKEEEVAAAVADSRVKLAEVKASSERAESAEEELRVAQRERAALRDELGVAMQAVQQLTKAEQTAKDSLNDVSREQERTVRQLAATNAELAKIKAGRAALENQLSELSTELAAAHAERLEALAEKQGESRLAAEATARLETVRETHEKLQAAHAQAVSKLMASTSDSEVAAKEAQQAAEKSERLLKEIDGLRRELAESTARAHTLQREKESALLQVQNETAARGRVEASMAASAEELSAAQSQLQEVRNALASEQEARADAARELQVSQDSIEQLQRKVARLETAAFDSEEHSSELQERIAQREAELRDARAAVATHKQELHELEAALAAANDSATAAATTSSARAAAAVALRTELEDAKATVRTQQGELEQLATQLRQATEDTEQARARADVLESSLQQAESRLGEAVARADSKAADVAHAEAVVADMQAEVERLKAAVLAESERTAKWRETCTKLEMDADSATRGRKRAEEQVASADAAIERLRECLQQEQATSKRLRGEISALQAAAFSERMGIAAEAVPHRLREDTEMVEATAKHTDSSSAVEHGHDDVPEQSPGLSAAVRAIHKVEAAAQQMRTRVVAASEDVLSAVRIVGIPSDIQSKLEISLTAASTSSYELLRDAEVARGALTGATQEHSDLQEKCDAIAMEVRLQRDRVRTLEDEAGRLREHLDGAEHRLRETVSERDELRRQLAADAERRQTLEKAESQSRRDAEGIAEDMRSLRKRLQEIVAERDRLEEQSREANEVRIAAEQRLAIAAEEMKSEAASGAAARRETESVRDQMAGLTHELSLREEEVTRRGERVEALESQVSELTASRDELARQLREAKSENEMSATELEQLRRANVGLTESVRELESRVSVLGKSAEELRGRVQASEKAAREAKSLQAQAEKRATEAAQQVSALRRKASGSEELVEVSSNLRQQLMDARKQIAKLEADRDGVERAHSQALRDWEEVVKLCEELKQERSSLQETLRRAESGAALTASGDGTTGSDAVQALQAENTELKEKVRELTREIKFSKLSEIHREHEATDASLGELRGRLSSARAALSARPEPRRKLSDSDRSKLAAAKARMHRAQPKALKDDVAEQQRHLAANTAALRAPAEEGTGSLGRYGYDSTSSSEGAAAHTRNLSPRSGGSHSPRAIGLAGRSRDYGKHATEAVASSDSDSDTFRRRRARSPRQGVARNRTRQRARTDSGLTATSTGSVPHRVRHGVRRGRGRGAHRSPLHTGDIGEGRRHSWLTAVSLGSWGGASQKSQSSAELMAAKIRVTPDSAAHGFHGDGKLSSSDDGKSASSEDAARRQQGGAALQASEEDARRGVSVAIPTPASVASDELESDSSGFEPARRPVEVAAGTRHATNATTAAHEAAPRASSGPDAADRMDVNPSRESSRGNGTISASFRARLAQRRADRARRAME